MRLLIWAVTVLVSLCVIAVTPEAPRIVEAYANTPTPTPHPIWSPGVPPTDLIGECIGMRNCDAKAVIGYDMLTHTAKLTIIQVGDEYFTFMWEPETYGRNYSECGPGWYCVSWGNGFVVAIRETYYGQQQPIDAVFVFGVENEIHYFPLVASNHNSSD